MSAAASAVGLVDGRVGFWVVGGSAVRRDSLVGWKRRRCFGGGGPSTSMKDRGRGRD